MNKVYSESYTTPPADTESQFATINGLRLHYKSAGQGTPVLVLIHGSFLSLFSWRDVLVPLSACGTVIAFDRPAFGLTERPIPDKRAANNPYSPEAQADLTIALLDHLGIQQAVLVGNSTGGTIALLAALRHPQRVQALVLASAMVYSGYAVSEFPTWIRPLLPVLRLPGMLMMRTMISMLQDRLTRSFWYRKEAVTPDILAENRRRLRIGNWPRALWELTLACHALEFEQHLDRVHIPALVITGDQDRTVHTDESIRLAEALPQAVEPVILPECGHLPHEECPQEFVQAVQTFLSTAASK